MKSTCKVIFVGGFLLLIASVVVAQQRTVTRAEIEKLEARAEAKLEKLSYRKKTTVKTASFSYRKTDEILMPNRWHEVSEDIKTQTASPSEASGSSRYEYIGIGNKTYSRKGNGLWKISPPLLEPPDDFLEVKPFKGLVLTNEYLYLGEQTLNGIVSDLYQVTAKLTNSLGRGDYFRQSVKKIWFDKKGRLLKKQVEATYTMFNTSEQAITEYEYDVPIKIEAPIKQKKRKGHGRSALFFS